MTTQLLRGAILLERVTIPTIINSTTYAENTDIWSAGTKTILRWGVVGPGTVAIKSYGGQATAYVDGTSSLALDGLGTTGQSQNVSVGTGCHIVELRDPVDANGGRSYAFAYVNIPDYSTGTTYDRGDAALNELTPSISNYGGYDVPTDVWTAGTKTVVTLSTSAGRLVIVYYCAGKATTKADGTAIRDPMAALPVAEDGDVHSSAAVMPGTGTVSFTIVNPSDQNSKSFALAKVEEYPPNAAARSFGHITT